MGWAPIGLNAIYREIIQRKSFTKKKKKSIYFARLHGNNTYLQGNKFTKLFNKKN